MCDGGGGQRTRSRWRLDVDVDDDDRCEDDRAEDATEEGGEEDVAEDDEGDEDEDQDQETCGEVEEVKRTCEETFSFSLNHCGYILAAHLSQQNVHDRMLFAAQLLQREVLRHTFFSTPFGTTRT